MCGIMRKAGNDGWYWEVNRLADIQWRVLRYFRRFPLVGTKAHDFAMFAQAVDVLTSS